MALTYEDTEHGNVLAVEFPGPEADVRDNRAAHDAISEVPHRFDSADRMVMSWAAGFATAVLLMVLGGWIV